MNKGTIPHGSTRAVLMAGLAVVLAHAAVSTRVSQDTEAPPPAFARVCSKCHDGTRVVEGRRLRSQWEETLEKMVALGAAGTDEDFEAVLEYLVRVHGRVNVNTAAAAEIGLVLHFEDGHASAIVTFREEHGRFADFEALAKVPGIPVEALKKVRDAILF